nr:NUDIX hydrolase [uncultured Celeribacter sp.]
MSGDVIQHPKVAVLAVCAQADRLLLVQRRNPPDAGIWGFPGGHVDWGETLQDAAVRELHEETGVTARPGGVLDLVEVIDRRAGATDLVDHHFLLVAVACHYVAGKAVAADDADAAEWVSLADIVAGTRPLSDKVAEVARKAVEQQG